MAKGVNLGSNIDPVKRIFLEGRLKNLDKELLKHISTKQVALDMVEIFRSAVNPYIPSDSGTIREKGYVIQLSNNKKAPWGKLIYRNTKEVPYVMYQYVGKIWRPNFAIFEREMEKFNPKSLKLRPANIKYNFVGWRTSKKVPRSPTPLNFRRRKVRRVFKRGNIVKEYTLYGYHNRNSQPRWVEYAAIKDQNWRSNIRTYAERVYSDAIEQVATDKQQKALRAQKNKPSKTANEILGIKNGVTVRTRLRKKDRE